MNILFTDDAWEDYLYWQQTDKQTLKKINQLLKEIQRTPFTGIGKPEPLKHQLQGCWSRCLSPKKCPQQNNYWRSSVVGANKFAPTTDSRFLSHVEILLSDYATHL